MLLLLRTISKHCQRSLWPSCPLPGPRPEPVLQSAPHYQVFLDGQDAAPGSLAVGPLARDDDGLRIAIFCWKVNLGIAFFTNLREERHSEKQLPLRQQEPRARNKVPPSNLKPEWHRTRWGRVRRATIPGTSRPVTFLMFAPPFPMMFL